MKYKGRSRPAGDRISRWFLAAIALSGLVYVGFGWTPSSYGMIFNLLQARGAGPVAGTSQPIRSDEWAVETPYFQAAVRNRFQRMNETSFYHEDLRNYYPLPLADWSLAFKPQMWAFFVLPPAIAFSIYHALWMCAFLVGYHLLFRELGVPAGLSVAATLIVFFSGFTQFWWTTYGPLLAGLSWILLIVLHPMAWWKKTLVCAWAFPTFVFSHVYPTLLLNLAWGALIVILAFRPSVLRSRGDIAAVVTGAIAAVVLVYAYYWDVIPIMRNTVYPGHRIAPPGGTPIFVALSQIFPSLCFRIGDYQSLTRMYICEMGTVGSFLPLLTLCLTRYRALRVPSAARKTLLILLAGFAAITLWETAPVPAWIGHMLLWDTGDSPRWLFTSGLLLTLASLSIWSNQLISPHPFRITLFVLIGPLASVLLKTAWLAGQGLLALSGIFDRPDEIVLCGVLCLAGLASWRIPAAARLPTLLIAIVLTNVYTFGRFNPLQPARPIFHIPDTVRLQELRREAAASPDGVLLDNRLPGAAFNGLGFRSVGHTLLAPQVALFRRYFPAMNSEKFNWIFNRYSHILVERTPMPYSPYKDVIEVPMEVFVPVRNLRRLTFAHAQPGACSQPRAGGISRVSQQGDRLTIEGWAPWNRETVEQGILMLSATAIRSGSLSTVTRPDIAEQLQDYGFVKSGFELRISSADGKPLRPENVVLFAFGTAQGQVRLACCGCT